MLYFGLWSFLFCTTCSTWVWFNCSHVSYDLIWLENTQKHKPSLIFNTWQYKPIPTPPSHGAHLTLFKNFGLDVTKWKTHLALFTLGTKENYYWNLEFNYHRHRVLHYKFPRADSETELSIRKVRQLVDNCTICDNCIIYNLSNIKTPDGR